MQIGPSLSHPQPCSHILPNLRLPRQLPKMLSILRWDRAADPRPTRFHPSSLAAQWAEPSLLGSHHGLGSHRAGRGLDRLLYRHGSAGLYPAPCLLSGSRSQARHPFPFPIALQESRAPFSSLTTQTSTVEWLILQTRGSFHAGASQQRGAEPGGCSRSRLAFFLLPSLHRNPSF